MQILLKCWFKLNSDFESCLRENFKFAFFLKKLCDI